MKGWKFTKPFELVESEINLDATPDSTTKVRIVKALLTIADTLRYSGVNACENVVLGSSGIGIVSETDTNLLDIEKGQRIYIQSKRGCGECYKCIQGNKSKCQQPLTAGEDYDGFLCDFMNVPTDCSYPLPEVIKDTEALFIDQISLALTIIDKLNVNKGDYVTVVGANNLGIILAQLLIYYQAVPIVLTNDPDDAEMAKKSDIYYVLSATSDWNKEISVITSNRLTSKIAYIADCNIPISKAFSVAAQNASIVYTGALNKSSAISFVTAVKKQLNILCINSGYGNTEASINLITNNAINFNNLKIDTIKYQDVPTALNEMSETLKKTGKVSDTIVEMI